ncbi:MAG TPA: 6-carboxytetrahydropterin synthase [Caulobacteraceae bacterium]|jgi:6-pyruvoyltetrahydropterin/6-carboxytetrahydropterin synthase
MTEPVFEITKAAQFDAAHSLDDGPVDGRYRRLHGHSFRVEASVKGGRQGPGWVADLGALDQALKALAGELDHGLLNEKEGLSSPTLENLCLYFADRLKVEFPGLSRVVVSRPTIGESASLTL